VSTDIDPDVHPAELWPITDDQEDDEPAGPPRWVWDAMEPAERRARLRELATWTEWLVATFQLQTVVPQCWFRHRPVVEHLTALHIGWVRSYTDPSPGRDMPEADWLSTLHAFIPHLQISKCSNQHEEPTLRRWQMPTDPGLEQFLEDPKGFGGHPPTHPSAALTGELAALREEPAL